jgi:hypothetical protein
VFSRVPLDLDIELPVAWSLSPRLARSKASG